MSVLIILLFTSIIIATGFLVAFLWSVKNGQYDDEFSAANRVVFQDSTIEKPITNK